MNVVVEEWIRKADGDFRTAGRELEADPPNYDAVCNPGHIGRPALRLQSSP